MAYLTLAEINGNETYAPSRKIDPDANYYFIKRVTYENSRDEINKLRKEYKNYANEIIQCLDPDLDDDDGKFETNLDEFIRTGNIHKCKSKRLNSLLKFCSDNDWYGSFTLGGKRKWGRDDYANILSQMKSRLNQYKNMKC